MFWITDLELSEDPEGLALRAHRGEEFIITLDGRPVARLGALASDPVSIEASREKRTEAQQVLQDKGTDPDTR